jgi:hypothetical protein
VFLVSLAVMLVMGPAAYHRQAQPESTSHAFVRFASRCLTGAIGALALLAGFFGFWFVWPRINARAK